MAEEALASVCPAARPPARLVAPAPPAPRRLQGLFSLAIPGRVGYQCAAQYRKTLGAGEQDGTRATAAESAACLAHHAPQIDAMWSSASAQRWVVPLVASGRQLCTARSS